MPIKATHLLALATLVILCLSNCGVEPASEKTSEGAPAEQVARSDAGSPQDAGPRDARAVDGHKPGERSQVPDAAPQPDRDRPDGGTPREAKPRDASPPTERGRPADARPVPEAAPEAARPEARPPTPRPFKKGANVLFIGHSFFIHAAHAYDEISTHAAHKGSFPAHSFAREFASGEGGAPGALWADASRKARILKKLGKGQVDLLAMTAHLSKSTQKDYQNWIDAALSANPKTQFLISCPWSPYGPRLTAAEFEAQNELFSGTLFQVVVALRKANPGVVIHYLNHGRVAVIAKNRFDKGSLKSAAKACCSDASLFEDKFGHGGDIIDKSAGLLILSYLTGLTSLSPKVYPSLDHNEMLSIVNEALKHNKKKGYLP